MAAMASKFKTVSSELTLEEAFSPENIRSRLKKPEDIYRFEYCTMNEKQFKSIAISPLAWTEGENRQAATVLFMAQDVTAEKLVEDNDLNREVAQEIISMTGAEVVTAENGKDAVGLLASAKEGDYNLVFMDIQMPVMNGYEATAAIRSLHKQDGKTIPIVAMTANAFAEDILLAKNAGMNEHISKPLDMTRLRDVLRRWL